MRFNNHFISVLIFCSFSSVLFAQNGNEDAAGRISPKELAIPAAPVFDLMDVTPSQITRSSDIKDFKVDWSFKSWKLSPNLAIQGQPFWEFIYNRKDLKKYQQASSFMRHLSSLDVSIGTVQNEDNDRRIGFSTKLNIYKQKDPLLADGLYEDISTRYNNEKQDLEKQLRALQTKLDTTQDILQKPDLRNQIKAIEDQQSTWNSRRNQEINNRAKIFIEENWNASSIDIAFGKIFTYKTDSAGSLLSLRLDRNTGWGTWINGSFGVGKKMLLSGLFRTFWYQEQLNFTLRNKITSDVVNQTAIAENNLYSLGLNLRYGGAIYTFFVEFLYEEKGLKTPVEALNEAFDTPENLEVVPSSVKWNVVHPNSLSLGGDWRISRNLILNYGMRCVFDKNWKMQTFTPIASISCMMR